MIRNCDVCQCAYTARRSTSKFCSERCRQRGHRGLGTPSDSAPSRGADTTSTSRSCDVCQIEYVSHRANSKFCSDTCRKRSQRGTGVPVPRVAAIPSPPRVRRPPALCNLCGKAMWSDPDSPPADQRRCQPCRRIEPQVCAEMQRRVCPWCEVEFQPRNKDSKACSRECAQRLYHGRPRGASYPSHGAARAALERSAPGLSSSGRKALRDRWVSQSRRCAYCVTAAGTTLDHVVPLSLGGSNFEGNLVPCCRPCNSSKARLLLVEWRFGHGSQLRRVPESLRCEAA